MMLKIRQVGMLHCYYFKFFIKNSLIIFLLNHSCVTEKGSDLRDFNIRIKQNYLPIVLDISEKLKSQNNKLFFLDFQWEWVNEWFKKRHDAGRRAFSMSTATIKVYKKINNMYMKMKCSSLHSYSHNFEIRDFPVYVEFDQIHKKSNK